MQNNSENNCKNNTTRPQYNKKIWNFKQLSTLSSEPNRNRNILCKYRSDRKKNMNKRTKHILGILFLY